MCEGEPLLEPLDGEKKIIVTSLSGLIAGTAMTMLAWTLLSAWSPQTYIIQPRINPKLVIDAKNVGAYNYLCITAPKSEMILPELRKDINIKIISKNGGGIYEIDKTQQSYGTYNNILFLVKGTGGNCKLEITFLHPNEWPKEINVNIYPSF